MGIATHWKVVVDPTDRGRHQLWIDDFKLAQRARWDEIVHQLSRPDWTAAKTAIRLRNDAPYYVRTIGDCIFWSGREDVAEIDESYSINDEVFNVACLTLADFGVRVSLHSLTISSKQLNRLLRVHSQHVSEEALIEVIAVKKAAG
jgi:hypothetical protein